MTFNFYGGNEDNQQLKHILDLWSYVVNKLPEEGTVVQKQVGAGIQHEACFMICFNYWILLVQNI
jgi:hypothetical protein